MALTVLDGPQAVLDATGTHLGFSDWLEITQERVDLFAEATGDHQWIHVDPTKAKDGPFGGTIAHGYLTLSLSNLFLPQIVEITGFSMGINYGANKVRFPAPVPVGSKVRGGAELLAVEEIPGGLQTTVLIAIEIDGGTKPACVIESISRYLV
ncbi:MAG: dehydratase [Acidimicrobiales bacterium]|nr:dehydratase [Acidimicrobiales bacterium]